MIKSDTIVAQATSPGRAGVGIIRISGPATKKIANKILGKKIPIRQACYLSFKNKQQQTIDQGIALLFESPHSFTGEDVLELQGHGGPVVLDLLLQEVLNLGARIARPGEFSERAYLNEKMDLVQAEAIADLINASSVQAAKSAVSSLQGDFSTAINVLVDGLIRLRMYVEAAIDFPEEEVDFLSEGKVEKKLQQLMAQLNKISFQAKQGALLKDGLKIVIAGKPNAGKSSLLNLLAQRESAIVTPVPGTTRDLLKEHILLEGIPLHIVDTAGLRESEDEVEKIGIARAWQEIKKADLLLFVVDATDKVTGSFEIVDLWHDLTHEKWPEIPALVVINKIDLTNKKSKLTAKTTTKHQGSTQVLVSIKEKQGIPTLITEIKNKVGFQQTEQGVFLARRRHLTALAQARKALTEGLEQMQKYQASELLAEELRIAQEALNQITGSYTADDLLGEIFSSFCIGK